MSPWLSTNWPIRWIAWPVTDAPLATRTDPVRFVNRSVSTLKSALLISPPTTKIAPAPTSTMAPFAKKMPLGLTRYTSPWVEMSSPAITDAPPLNGTRLRMRKVGFPVSLRKDSDSSAVRLNEAKVATQGLPLMCRWKSTWPTGSPGEWNSPQPAGSKTGGGGVAEPTAPSKAPERAPAQRAIRLDGASRANAERLSDDISPSPGRYAQVFVVSGVTVSVASAAGD